MVQMRSIPMKNEFFTTIFVILGLGSLNVVRGPDSIQRYKSLVRSTVPIKKVRFTNQITRNMLPKNHLHMLSDNVNAS